MYRDLKGIKQHGSWRYDRVIVETDDSNNVMVRSYDGYFQEGKTASVAPATARLIAAALIEAADKAEAGQ
jgi:hypothetical protein